MTKKLLAQLLAPLLLAPMTFAAHAAPAASPDAQRFLLPFSAAGGTVTGHVEKGSVPGTTVYVYQVTQIAIPGSFVLYGVITGFKTTGQANAMNKQYEHDDAKPWYGGVIQHTEGARHSWEVREVDVMGCYHERSGMPVLRDVVYSMANCGQTIDNTWIDPRMVKLDTALVRMVAAAQERAH